MATDSIVVRNNTECLRTLFITPKLIYHHPTSVGLSVSNNVNSHRVKINKHLKALCPSGGKYWNCTDVVGPNKWTCSNWTQVQYRNNNLYWSPLILNDYCIIHLNSPKITTYKCWNQLNPKLSIIIDSPFTNWSQTRNNNIENWSRR